MMEERIAAHGLEEIFFQLCHCVSFLVQREIVFGVTYGILRLQYSCGVVSDFLVLVGNSSAIVSKCKHRLSHFDFLYTVSKKDSYLVSLF
jgi:hypothetical protein